jgi:hypothetical protein
MQWPKGSVLLLVQVSNMAFGKLHSDNSPVGASCAWVCRSSILIQALPLTFPSSLYVFPMSAQHIQSLHQPLGRIKGIQDPFDQGELVRGLRSQESCEWCSLQEACQRDLCIVAKARKSGLFQTSAIGAWPLCVSLQFQSLFYGSNRRVGV